MPEGWLPPSPPTLGRTPLHPPAPVPHPRPDPDVPSNPLAVTAIAIGAIAILSLVFTLGTLFAFAALMSGMGLAAAWIVRRQARFGVPVRPGQARAAMLVPAIALGLAIVATLVWAILSASGYTPTDLQKDLEEMRKELQDRR